jgi:hypothetical protein
MYFHRFYLCFTSAHGRDKMAQCEISNRKEEDLPHQQSDDLHHIRRQKEWKIKMPTRMLTIISVFRILVSLYEYKGSLLVGTDKH